MTPPTPPKKQRKKRNKISHKTERIEIKTTKQVMAALQSICSHKQATKTDIIEALILAVSEQLGIQEIMELETQKKGIQARINELTDRINNKNQF
jgi:hypothetical protein